MAGVLGGPSLSSGVDQKLSYLGVLASSMVSIKGQASLTGSGLIHDVDHKYSPGFP